MASIALVTVEMKNNFGKKWWSWCAKQTIHFINYRVFDGEWRTFLSSRYHFYFVADVKWKYEEMVNCIKLFLRRTNKNSTKSVLRDRVLNGHICKIKSNHSKHNKWASTDMIISRLKWKTMLMPIMSFELFILFRGHIS